MVKNGDHGKEFFFIVFELCSNGEMIPYIQLVGGLPDNYAIGIFRQLLSAVEAVHAQSGAHGAIKLVNIFLDKSGCPKLVNFGIHK